MAANEYESPPVRGFMDDLSRSADVIFDLYGDAIREAKTNSEAVAINESLHVFGYMLIARAYVLHVNPLAASIRIRNLATDLRREIFVMESAKCGKGSKP